jgi:hypothetical protein
LTFALLSGCGPIVSGVQIIKADIQLSAAEIAGAKKLAPYEYTAAVEYLQKSREETGYSDFSAAREFAAKAIDYAKQAKEKAETLAKREQLAPAATP